MSVLAASIIISAVLGASGAARLDQYVSVAGSGDHSGGDFANARPAEQLQAALDALAPGGALFVGSGVYENVSLQWRTGGSGPEAMKSLVGVDTGEGLPVFRSNFDRTRPANTGITLLRVAPGVGYVAIRNLKVDGHSTAVRLEGRHRHLRLENIRVHNARDAFWFEGGAVPGDAESGTRDLSVRRCTVDRFTKRGFRILGGNSQMELIDCHVDAGGQEWAAEVFPIGFHVLGGDHGVTDHDITFTHCSALRAWHDAGAKYWNADGFAAERATGNLTWIGCLAAGNTDGGWDVKSTRATLVGCASIGNKRNFRFWASELPVTLENCLSAYSFEPKRESPGLGAWIQPGATVRMTRCTFWADGASLVVEDGSEQSPTALRLEKCLVCPIGKGSPQRFCPGVSVENTGSILQRSGEPPVRLQNPHPGWTGGDSDFDSVSHPQWGYRYVPPEAGAASSENESSTSTPR